MRNDILSLYKGQLFTLISATVATGLIVGYVWHSVALAIIMALVVNTAIMVIYLADTSIRLQNVIYYAEYLMNDVKSMDAYELTYFTKAMDTKVAYIEATEFDNTLLTILREGGRIISVVAKREPMVYDETTPTGRDVIENLNNVKPD